MTQVVYPDGTTIAYNYDSVGNRLSQVISNPSVPLPKVNTDRNSLTFSAAAGQAAPVQTIALSNSGGGSLQWNVGVAVNWLTVTPGSGTNAGTVNVTASAAGLSAGTYSANLLILASAANAPVTIPVIFTVTPAQGIPSISNGGIVSAAGSSPSMARGSVASIYGASLADVSASATTVPLPRTLGNVQVSVNGVIAPLWYADAGQINFQVPFEAPLQGPASVVVSRDGVASAPTNVALVPYAPSIFMYQRAAGALDPIIVHAATNQIVTPTSPAVPGEYVIAYGTGIGDLTTLPTTGALTPESPLAKATLTPTATIGGVTAVVAFAGLTPDTVGLAQFNIQVPTGLPAGSSSPLVITFNGAASQPVQLYLGGNTAPLSITTTSLPSATIGTEYAQPVVASGGQTPYAWSVSSGLPGGLAINSSTGAISGTPAASGTFSFTVTVQDSSSTQQTVSQVLSISVSGSTPASAGTVLSVTGPPVNNGTGLFPSNPLAFSFTVGQSYSNVSISADLVGTFSGTAYLMSQIGVGTTAANQIATGSFSSAGAFSGTMQTVLQNISLVPGTYFLVLSTSQSALPQGLQETNSPVIVSDVGASTNGRVWYSSSPAAYVPASAFGIANGGGGAYAPEFTVVAGPSELTPTWTILATQPTPRVRGNTNMVFDSVRGQMVLYGGEQNTTVLSDTWVFTGQAWTDRSSPTGPGVRSQHAMAFDAERGETVLFGGSTSWGGGGTLKSDTWTWNGSIWQDRTLPGGPSPRIGSAMTYDAGNKVVVLFGGSGLSDTWTWNGSAWQQRFPAQSPPPRANHAMVYDPINHVVVLFGGFASGNQVTWYNDTWIWDGVNWSQKTSTTAPSQRFGHGMMFDTKLGQVILQGGTTTDTFGTLSYRALYLNDTWAWSGAAWKLIPTSQSPRSSSGHGLAYDTTLQRGVFFAGFGTTSPQTAIWSVAAIP